MNEERKERKKEKKQRKKRKKERKGDKIKEWIIKKRQKETMHTERERPKTKRKDGKDELNNEQLYKEEMWKEIRSNYKERKLCYAAPHILVLNNSYIQTEPNHRW